MGKTINDVDKRIILAKLNFAYGRVVSANNFLMGKPSGLPELEDMITAIDLAIEDLEKVQETLHKYR